MATMKKAQIGAKIKKVVKKDDGNGANDYKNMVDKSTGKKGTMGGEGTNRGPNYNMLKKNGGSVKKAQNGGVTYSNLKVKNPTATDSIRYKSAYDKVMNNQRLNFPSRVEAEGSQEALKKLKDMKSKGVAKSKSGGSFPDLNKDGKITKKDILIGKGVLPKTAKKGAALKKQAATAIAMKKAGKTPKATMKTGGKMTKCKYGCK